MSLKNISRRQLLATTGSIGLMAIAGCTTQQETETNIAIEDDLTDTVAAIIVSTDNDTASKLIEEVSNVETETNLSLKVIAGISEKSAEKFTELAETNKEQVEKLTISGFA